MFDDEDGESDFLNRAKLFLLEAFNPEVIQESKVVISEIKDLQEFRYATRVLIVTYLRYLTENAEQVKTAMLAGYDRPETNGKRLATQAERFDSNNVKVAISNLNYVRDIITDLSEVADGLMAELDDEEREEFEEEFATTTTAWDVAETAIALLQSQKNGEDIIDFSVFK